MADGKDLNVAVNVVMILSVLVIAGAIGIFVADQTVAITPLSSTTGGAYATGTLNITGNIADAQNVTIGAVIYQFDTAGDGNATGTINVSTAGNLTKEFAANALKTAVNANVISSALVTATNPTAQTMLLTADSLGPVGNLATTETIVNGTWSGTTMTGGVVSSLASMQTNVLGAGETGAGFIVIVIIAFIGSVAIGFMFGLVGRKK